MPKYLSTKIDEAIILRARVIAAHLGVSTSDYLSNTLDPCIERDFEKMVGELGGGHGKGGSSGKGGPNPGNPGHDASGKPEKPAKKPPGGGEKSNADGEPRQFSRFSDDQGLKDPGDPGEPRESDKPGHPEEPGTPHTRDGHKKIRRRGDCLNPGTADDSDPIKQAHQMQQAHLIQQAQQDQNPNQGDDERVGSP